MDSKPQHSSKLHVLVQYRYNSIVLDLKPSQFLPGFPSLFGESRQRIRGKVGHKVVAGSGKRGEGGRIKGERKKNKIIYKCREKTLQL